MDTNTRTKVRTDDPTRRFAIGDRVAWHAKVGTVIGRMNKGTILVMWDNGEEGPAPAWHDALKRIFDDPDEPDARDMVSQFDFSGPIALCATHPADEWADETDNEVNTLKGYPDTLEDVNQWQDDTLPDLI